MHLPVYHVSMCLSFYSKVSRMSVALVMVCAPINVYKYYVFILPRVQREIQVLAHLAGLKTVQSWVAIAECGGNLRLTR